MKVGIFGGSFNPIHCGHLAVADTIWTEFDLDRVLFIPANVSPFKQKERNVVEAKHRLRMVELAIAGHDRFSCSDIELQRSGPSFTVDTLRQLHLDLPDAELFLLMGGDSIAGFHRWKEAEMILDLATIIGYARPDSEEPEFDFKDRLLHSRSALEMEVSSTDIRARIASGESVRYRISENVWSYINMHSLYRGE